MIRLNPAADAAEAFRASEMRHSLTVAGCFALGAVLSIPVMLALGWLISADVLVWNALMFIIPGVLGALATWAILSGLDKGRDHAASVLAILKYLTEKEIELKTTALPTSTYLPPETRSIPVTSGERVGELELVVNGFDPGVLEWFAVYLSNGNKTSEAAMEHLPYPVEGGEFGGLKAGTRLTRLLDLAELKQVLSVRDPIAHKPGKLLVKDKAEILKRLKSN